MSVLTIPANTVSHTLPTPFYAVSHQPNGSAVDILDATYIGLCGLLNPEIWRFGVFGGSTISPAGTVASPSGDTLYMFHNTVNAGRDWPTVMTANQATAPWFHWVLNGGPQPRPISGAVPPGVRGDTPNAPTGGTVEGSVDTNAAWAKFLHDTWGAKGLLVSNWNEPGQCYQNTQDFYSGNNSYYTYAFAPTNIRTYTAAMRAATPSWALGGVAIGAQAWADTSYVTGINQFIDQTVGGSGGAIGANWAWGNDNIAANAFDWQEWHAYSDGNDNSYARTVNAAANPVLFPPGTGGTPNSASGVLAGLDQVKALQTAAGGSTIPMYVSEWEPDNFWGRAGQGAVADALMAVIAVNRQARWGLRGFTFMDVIIDTLSFGTDPSMFGDQVIGNSTPMSSPTYVKMPRYHGLILAVGPMLRDFKKVVCVPMYTGDVGDGAGTIATWNTPPGTTTAAAPTGSVQRHQVSFQYNAAQTKAKITIVDLEAPGNQATEQCTIHLPFTMAANASTVVYMDPWFGYTTPTPGNSTPTLPYAPSSTPPSTTTPSLSGSTITTGSGSIPTLYPGSYITIEIDGLTPGGVPPANTVQPVISGLLTQGQMLTCSQGTWTGDPTITFAYQFQTATDAGFTSGITNVGTGSTYTTQVADVGRFVRCTVTGTNSTGSSSAASTIVGPVVAANTPALAGSSSEWSGDWGPT